MPKEVAKTERLILTKDDDHEYGLVTKVLGGSRFLIRLNLQETQVVGRLCGKFKKGSAKKANWVSANTWVLVGLRDYQDNAVDIVHVYTDSEVRRMKKDGTLVDIEQPSDNKDTTPCVEDDSWIFDEI
jgi:initiation factor 1A